jgi:F420H(2)-dependent quinone reductase
LYRKLAKEAQVEVEVKGEVFRAQARTATGRERRRLRRLGAGLRSAWERFQAGTERQIPVVVLERTRAAAHDTRFEEVQG